MDEEDFMDAVLALRLKYELIDLESRRAEYARRLEQCRGFESVRIYSSKGKKD